MPSSPASPSMCTRELMSMKSVAAVASGSFWKVRTTPPCSTTNQREVSFGAWSIAVGAKNARFGKARGVSRPLLHGGGAGTGMPPPPLPPHPMTASETAAGTRLRRFMFSFLVGLPCQDRSNGAKFRRRGLQRPVLLSKAESDQPCGRRLVAEGRQGNRRDSVVPRQFLAERHIRHA